MAKTKKEPDWVKNPPKGFKVSKGKKRDLQMAIEDAKLGYGDTAGAEQWIEAGPDGDWIGYVLVPDKSTKSALEQEVQKASEPVAAGSDATTAAIGDSTGTKFGVSTSDRGDYSEDDLSDLDAKIEELEPADLKKIVREIATEEIEAPPTWESETISPPPTIASETVAPPPTMASETIAPEPTMESETVRGVDPKSGISARLASDDERANFQRQLQSQIEQPRDTRGGPNMTTPAGNATQALQRDTRGGTNMTTPVGNATQPQGESSGSSWYDDPLGAAYGAINEAGRDAISGAQGVADSIRTAFDPGKPTPPDAGAAATPGLDPNLPAEFSRPSVPLRGSMGPGMGDAQHGNIFKQPPPESPPQGQITMKEPSAGYNERMRDAYVSPATEQEAPRETRPFSNADLPTAVAKAFQPDPNAMRTEDITSAMAPMRNFNWNRPTTPTPPPAAPELGPQMPNEREMRGQALMDSMASRAQTEASQNQGTAAQQAMEAQMTQNDSGSSYQQSRAVEKEGPGLGGKAKGILGKIRDFVDKGADTPAAKYSLDPRKRSREEQQELEAWMAAGRPNDWNWEPKKAIGRRPKLTGSLR